MTVKTRTEIKQTKMAVCDGCGKEEVVMTTVDTYDDAHPDEVISKPEGWKSIDMRVWVSEMGADDSYCCIDEDGLCVCSEGCVQGAVANAVNKELAEKTGSPILRPMPITKVAWDEMRAMEVVPDANGLVDHFIRSDGRRVYLVGVEMWPGNEGCAMRFEVRDG